MHENNCFKSLLWFSKKSNTNPGFLGIMTSPPPKPVLFSLFRHLLSVAAGILFLFDTPDF